MATANCLAMAINLFNAGVRSVALEGNALYAKEDVNNVLRNLLP
jgi:hypothetical protein